MPLWGTLCTVTGLDRSAWSLRQRQAKGRGPTALRSTQRSAWGPSAAAPLDEQDSAGRGVKEEVPIFLKVKKATTWSLASCLPQFPLLSGAWLGPDNQKI